MLPWPSGCGPMGEAQCAEQTALLYALEADYESLISLMLEWTPSERRGLAAAAQQLVLICEQFCGYCGTFVRPQDTVWVDGMAAHGICIDKQPRSGPTREEQTGELRALEVELREEV